MYSLFGDSQEYDIFGTDISDIEEANSSGIDSDEEYFENINELLEYAEELHPSL